MKIGLNTSNTRTLKLTVSSNTDVSAFHFSVTGLPIKTVTCLDANKICDFNGDKIIVYGMNKLPIANGDLLNIEFTTPVSYGSYPITLTPLSASTGEALNATLEKGANGLIALTFSVTQVKATADQIIGKGSSGVDANNSGLVEITDLQIVINNVG